MDTLKVFQALTQYVTHISTTKHAIPTEITTSTTTHYYYDYDYDHDYFMIAQIPYDMCNNPMCS